MQSAVCFCVCINFISLAFSQNPDLRGRSDYSQYGPNERDRYFSRYSEDQANLPHSWSDDRCVGDRYDEERQVATNFGRVNGKTVRLCDGPELSIRQRPGQTEAVRSYKTINVFLGIPYAEPPTRRNNLQFEPPRFPQRWNAIDVLHYKPSCPQHQDYLGMDKGYNITDEDCLYLNIYTPAIKSTQQQGYPVMIYIHGGNWDHGSANTFPGHMLAAQDVVVVTFNYRLGHLGFLSTADKSSIGNYGILDQVLALRWVYENIGPFFGDRDSITLFGTDAGAASASLLAMSPLSRHMVKRVIAQNGAPIADWAAIVDPTYMVNSSQALGEGLGCSSEDSFRLVECAKQRSNNDIRILRVKPRFGWLPWGPVVDNFTNTRKSEFLPKAPIDILKEGNPFRHDFTYMSGVSRDQGAKIVLLDPTLRQIHYRFTDSIIQMKIKDFMTMYNYSINADGIFRAIKFMYSPSLNAHNETLLRQSYINLLTDKYYNAPNFEMGKLIADKVPVYMYVSNYSLWGYRPFDTWEGITSDTEYFLTTGAPFLHWKYYPSKLNLRNSVWSEADRDMSAFYLQAWTNFAKDGNPTRHRFLNSIFWEKMTKENFVFLNINSTEPNITRYVTDRMVRDYRERESEFWNCYLPFLIGREPPTPIPTLEAGVEELRVVTSALYGSATAGALFLIIALVGCCLYCRIRRYDSY